MRTTKSPGSRLSSQNPSQEDRTQQGHGTQGHPAEASAQPSDDAFENRKKGHAAYSPAAEVQPSGVAEQRPSPERTQPHEAGHAPCALCSEIDSSGHPVSEPRPIGVAADRQGIADLLERLTMQVARLADASEGQNRSVIQALPPEALSCEQAARFLGVERPTIMELIRTGKLPYVQYGKQRGRVILVRDLRRFVEQHRQASDEEVTTKKKRA
jgi:excisionase family DNA binding protein